MLPEESGIQVCQKIREHDQEVVIVMITARDAEEDKLLGFKVGADDYVTKPFGMKELSARIKANLKRSLASSASPRGKVLEYGNLWLDTKDFTARLEGEPLNLRLMEFKILAALASQPGTLNTPTPTVTRRRHPGHQKSVRLEAYGQNRAGSWLWSSWVYWFYSCYGSVATRAEDAHIASGLAQVSRDRCPLQSLAGVAP